MPKNKEDPLKNGLFPANALGKTKNGFTLTAPAAASYDRLNAAFTKRFGYALNLSGGYRDYATQERIFLQRYRVQLTGNGPFGDVRWWNLKRYVRFTGAAAARPGTSNHGLGIAIDISTAIGFGSFTSAQFKWLASNGPAYGWTNTEGRAVNEPWHWVYNASNDKHKGNGSSPGTGAKPANLTTDGIWGSATTKRMQQILGTTADGEIWHQPNQWRTSNPGLTTGWKWSTKPKSSPAIAALQKRLGVKADGLIGPATIRAFQRKMGTKADGSLWKNSPAIKKFQQNLNQGKLW